MVEDFSQELEEIEKLIQEGKLDEAKDKVAKLMGNVNINLSDTLEKIGPNQDQDK